MNLEYLFQNFMQYTVTLSEAMDVLTENLEFDGITRVQFNILQHIALEQPVTPSQISHCQNMSLPNTSREIKKLTERGFIYKNTDKKDRRKTYIHLTESGTNLMNNVSTCMEERFCNSISNLVDSDIKKIEDSLECMSNLLLKQIKNNK